MSLHNQPDLFGSDEPELFDENAAPREYRANPDEVRAELNRLLSQARAASSFPWEPRKVALYRTIFPQMANWLPENEAKQLCFEFETELARLEHAA